MNKLEAFFAGAKSEFGLERNHEDFEQITFIPDGFESYCNHNDTCPLLGLSSDTNATGHDIVTCCIGIAPKNPENREEFIYEMENNISPSKHQFNIFIDGGGKGYYYEYCSNSWQDIADHAEKAREIVRTISKTCKEKNIDTESAKDFLKAFQKVSKMAEDAGFFYWK